MTGIIRRMHTGGTIVNGHYVPTMDEMMAYQAARGARWEDSVTYGYGTVWFCLAILAIFFIARWLEMITSWTRVNQTPHIVPEKLVALLRVCSYPRLPYSIARIVNVVWTIGPLGPNIMLFIALLFTSLYCWVARHYYSTPFYGSPPLALRSEWIATALIPFVFVLGAKRNLISWVVGVSHEKLQVFHQGVAFLIVYMSLVHTISMVVQACSERPFRDAYVSDYVWWSGFAALGALLWLWLGSLPVLRHRLYEGAYLLHIAAAIMFIGFLYYHGFSLLDTDLYMKITLGLFGFGFLARFVYMVITNVLFKHRAQLSLQNGFVRVTIPTNIKWRPGMHIFVRFLHIRPFESHPFTISSLPGADAKDGSKNNELVFLVKIESGFTHSLGDCAAQEALTRQFPVILDGPYGESGANTLRSYDSVLLLAGGMGLTFITPILSDLARSMKQKTGICKTVDVVLSAKHRDVVRACEAQLLGAQSVIRAAGGTIEFYVHITGDSTGEEGRVESRESEKEVALDDGSLGQIIIGRPDIAGLVSSRAMTWNGYTAVAVCGPLSFLTSASNAVARVQWDILRGSATCKEMHLRSETFGW